jgi:hypothetical protein
VRPGDNIWNITEEYLTDIQYWRKLQVLNAVTDPEHIPPGSRLRIPIAWLKVQPTAVRVIAVQGKVEAIRAATGETVPVAVGLALYSGDTIRTGPESNVTLEFGDQSRLLLQADSHLMMDTLSAYGGTGMVDTRVRLQQGRVDSRVTPRRGLGSPRYEIWTPAFTSAVRGTEYRVSAETNQPVARAEVLAGAVGVSGAGKTRLVAAQFGTLAKVGEVPAAPIRLLAPPDVSGLAEVFERVPLQISIPSVEGAVAYRLQIAPNEEFKTLLFDRTSPSAQILGPDLPDGDYVLRLRGIDSKGLEGIDASRRFSLNARPEPPFLVEPKPNTILYDNSPTFQWSEPEKATGYHFQLADSASFAVPLIDRRDYAKVSLTPDQALKTGSYYWRVATRSASGEEGPFSDPQMFKLQPSPTVEAPTLEEDSMVLRWNGVPGQRYQFQLAKDRGFTEVIVDRTVSGPEVKIPLPEPGFHYLRISMVDADGFQGPYGPTQRITVPPRNYWPFGVFAILVVVLLL